MATSAVNIIAAAVAKARREVRRYFEDRDAFGPSRAVAYDPPGRLHRRQLERMVARKIIQTTADGRYWIDRAALRQEQERQSAAAWTAFVIVAVFLVSALGLALLVAH